jgi:hypothetical protein
VAVLDREPKPKDLRARNPSTLKADLVGALLHGVVDAVEDLERQAAATGRTLRL